MRHLTLVLILLAVAGCGGSGPVAGPSPSSSPSSSPSAPPVPSYTAARCPVADPALCERAAVAAKALTVGDIPALVELGRPEDFRCDELPAELFPDCEPGATLRGYASTRGDQQIRVIDEVELRAELGALVGGEPEVLGVGTCGPADPARRSYHLAFAAEVQPGSGGEPERWLGSLEFVLRDGSWVFALVFADTESGWRRAYADPAAELACGNILPWPPE